MPKPYIKKGIVRAIAFANQEQESIPLPDTLLSRPSDTLKLLYREARIMIDRYRVQLSVEMSEERGKR